MYVEAVNRELPTLEEIRRLRVESSRLRARDCPCLRDIVIRLRYFVPSCRQHTLTGQLVELLCQCFITSDHFRSARLVSLSIRFAKLAGPGLHAFWLWVSLWWSRKFGAESEGN